MTQHLTILEIAGIPLPPSALHLLSKGLASNTSSSLRTLSLARTNLGDSGLLTLVSGIKAAKGLCFLNLAACNLTDRGASTIGDLIKSQAVQRQAEKWVHTLRAHPLDPLREGCVTVGLAAPAFDTTTHSSEPVQRRPPSKLSSSSCIPLQRINLCSNPLGDTGLMHLLEPLHEQIGLLGLDLQRTLITDAGARLVQQVLEVNQEILVVDLRNNGVCEVVWRVLRGCLEMNRRRRREERRLGGRKQVGKKEGSVEEDEEEGMEWLDDVDPLKETYFEEAARIGRESAHVRYTMSSMRKRVFGKNSSRASSAFSRTSSSIGKPRPVSKPIEKRKAWGAPLIPSKPKNVSGGSFVNESKMGVGSSASRPKSSAANASSKKKKKKKHLSNGGVYIPSAAAASASQTSYTNNRMDLQVHDLENISTYVSHQHQTTSSTHFLNPPPTQPPFSPYAAATAFPQTGEPVWNFEGLQHKQTEQEATRRRKEQELEAENAILRKRLRDLENLATLRQNNTARPLPPPPPPVFASSQTSLAYQSPYTSGFPNRGGGVVDIGPSTLSLDYPGGSSAALLDSLNPEYVSIAMPLEEDFNHHQQLQQQGEEEEEEEQEEDPVVTVSGERRVEVSEGVRRVVLEGVDPRSFQRPEERQQQQQQQQQQERPEERQQHQQQQQERPEERQQHQQQQQERPEERQQQEQLLKKREVVGRKSSTESWEGLVPADVVSVGDLVEITNFERKAKKKEEMESGWVEIKNVPSVGVESMEEEEVLSVLEARLASLNELLGKMEAEKAERRKVKEEKRRRKMLLKMEEEEEKKKRRVVAAGERMEEGFNRKRGEGDSLEDVERRLEGLFMVGDHVSRTDLSFGYDVSRDDNNSEKEGAKEEEEEALLKLRELVQGEEAREEEVDEMGGLDLDRRRARHRRRRVLMAEW
ncbi:hypothetical protein HDV05_007577 [Chytridiales sp. JEL 0842]|nr:hypothetical protein HDV05_007577 [Chytridiales sp. JEL 0842]